MEGGTNGPLGCAAGWRHIFATGITMFFKFIFVFFYESTFKIETVTVTKVSLAKQSSDCQKGWLE